MDTKDRELLELAAKAAGYKRLNEMPVARDMSFFMIEEADGGRFTPWNPLTGDGDALRLAVSLKLGLVVLESEVSVILDVVDEDGPSIEYFDEPYEGDRMASTRRAIVRAAADIGRAM